MEKNRLLEVMDQVFKNKYNVEKLEVVGYSVSGANIIVNYKDGDMAISTKISHKAAMQHYFDFEKSRGKFKNVDFEKFHEKVEEGIKLEEIEKVIKTEQLNFEGE